MADSKITALTALTAADPTNDMIPIVDVSDTPPASGNTKRISINNILSSSPTASGALTVTGLVTAGSATISGALTVDTTTLVVNPSGYVDRVGIGTATPGAALEVSGSATNIYIRSTDTNDSALRYYVNGTEVAVCRGKNGGSYAIETAGTERLRIDSSGNVGIAVTPSAWATYKSVSVGGIGACVFGLGTSQAGIAQGAFYNNGAGSGWAYSATAQVPTHYLQINGENIWNIVASGTANAQITAWTQAMKLDASGNLILLSSNTPATLVTNGQLTVNATSNTNLRFSYRGSDGTTRVANITLA